MKRLMPSPPLSLTLLVVWLLLNQSLAATTWLTGVIMAIAVPILTKSLRPATVRMRRPGVALRLAGDTIVDMSVSALHVGQLILTRRKPELNGYFVRVPLRLRDPNGLAVLAMIMCLTPGTAWGELSFDRSTLLIHVFDLVDEAEFVERIRVRYEQPLMEIFE